MSNKFSEKFMTRAIELSREAGIIKKTGGVFGAIIVKNDQIISEGFNKVLLYNDPTCHAEIDAIRQACKKIGSPHLSGHVLYTSAQCCPMCLSAAYWAHIDNIYYASTIEDAFNYGNFQDLDMYKEICLPNQERKIQMTQFMQKEAVEVWKEFSNMPDRAKY